MREQGGGRIVNVTSLNDVLSSPFVAWYASSKAALAAASYSLAAEVAQFGIAVTVVSPGRFKQDSTAAPPDMQTPSDSPYRAALSGMTKSSGDRSSAGDPDEVGAVIEECVEGENPPARIAVGADVEELLKLASDPNDYVATFAKAIADASG
jgi:NAD(P)-dependent dehydrogenase (short-subunit alcohol dehydrogenase family)